MAHPNDGDLLACMDGELEPEHAGRVRSHLGACDVCQARWDLLRNESERFSHALLDVDTRLNGRAHPGPIPIRGAGVARHPFRRTGWSLARAAGLVLVAAGAAGALVPGSPVRDWLANLLTDTPGDVTSPGTEAPGSATARSDLPLGPTAISVEPADGNLVVNLRGFRGPSNVYVGLTDGGRGAVRVEGASVSPRFVTGPGLLEVVGTEEVDVWVELPRSARETVVQVDGAVAVRVRDGELLVSRPMLDSLREVVVFRIED